MEVELLKLLLKGTVDTKILISWLSSTLSEDETPVCLLEFANCRPHFTAFFLSFLRDQAAVHIRDFQHSGLTPRKSLIKVKRVSDTEELKSGVSSRARLNFEKGRESLGQVSDESSIDVSHISDIIESRTKSKVQGDQHVVTSKHHSNKDCDDGVHFLDNNEYKSSPKLRLGHFILDSVFHPPRKRGDARTVLSPKYHKQTSNFQNKGQVNQASFDLDDQKAFPPITQISSSTQRKNTRRIAPTPVKHCKTAFLSDAANISAMNSEDSETSPSALTISPINDDKHFSVERELLKKERTRRQQDFEASTPTSIVQHYLRPYSGNQDQFTNVFVTDVTFKNELDILSMLFSGCITANLVPSFVVELYFIFQLLTIRGKDNTGVYFEAEIESFFDNVANCVYFAIQVMWSLRRLLVFLDNGTLRLLLENPRLREFSPDLIHFIKSATERICTSGELITSSTGLHPFNGVAFQSDADNRNNFISDHEFNSFKRKRDLFYEILREWESKHLTVGWTFAEALGSRIKSLVAFGDDATACLHFARLFQAQLIATCTNMTFGETSGDGYPELLTVLRQADPKKYKRLQERFVAPNHCGGPCPPPSFPGRQEFFKTFIIISSSPAFNQHLIDGFSAHIKELNSFELCLTENSDDIDYDEREKFLHSLLSLRLLAKFLGFLIFLPYRGSRYIPESSCPSQILLRSCNLPLFDVNSYLQHAIEAKRTVLVVPWIVEFLAMMDSVAPYLPYYSKILEALFCIYRSQHLIMEEQTFRYNEFFIVLLIGWLFEVVGTRQFPSSLNEIEVSLIKFNLHTPCVASPFPPCTALDSVSIVDQRILYFCYPYLCEFRMLLSEFNFGISSRAGSVRKIKPISADSGHLMPPLQEIELQLENNFFHNQPVSLKKTVEFVSDRLSSNVIKHIRKFIIPASKRLAIEDIKAIGASLEVTEEGEVLQKSKLWAAKKVAHKAQAFTERVKQEGTQFAQKYCPNQSGIVVRALLPEDTAPSVIDICIRIVKRSSQKTILQWLSTHLTSDIFYSELLHEMQKIMKALSRSCVVHQVVDCNTMGPHDDNVIAPAEAILSLKTLLQKLLYGPDDHPPVTNEEVAKSLQSVISVINQRQDLLPLAFKTLLQLTIDLATAIIIRCPETMEECLQTEFILLWNSQCHHTTELFNSLFSCRNFQHLSRHCTGSQASWSKLKTLTLDLISNKLLSTTSFRDQCAVILQQHWTQDFHHQVADYVNDVINHHVFIESENMKTQYQDSVLSKCDNDFTSPS